jgi:hypothetical protein
VWGEGEARAPALVLHTFGMHVDLSFSYLRFAEAVSFDIKKSYEGAIQKGTVFQKMLHTRIIILSMRLRPKLNIR